MNGNDFEAILKEIERRSKDTKQLADIIHTYFEPSPYRREAPRFIQFLVGLHLDIKPLYNIELGKRTNRALKAMGYASVRDMKHVTVRGIEVKPAYYGLKQVMVDMMTDYHRVDRGSEYWQRYSGFKSILKGITYDELIKMGK